MIAEPQSVSRENFDSSGLSTGYTVSSIITDIETNILRLVKGVFGGIGDVKVKDINRQEFLSATLAQSELLKNRSVELFQSQQANIFSNLNASISNGFNVGVSTTKRELTMNTSFDSGGLAFNIADLERGKDIINGANASILSAEAKSIDSAVSKLLAGIALIIGGAVPAEMSVAQAYDDFIVPTFTDGLTGKVTSDGKNLTVGTYSEGITRENSQQALLLGESVVAGEAGYYLVHISAHASSCPLCRPWEDTILVDDVYTDGKPDGQHKRLSAAIASGLFHYNCRHKKTIYIPGKFKHVTPANYDPEKSAVNYELEQIQRRMERNIRIEKRKFEMSLSVPAINQASAKIKQYQANIRSLERYAEENGYKMYRHNWKEQVSYVTPKPTRPYEIPGNN
jgi:hypothetical protein